MAEGDIRQYFVRNDKGAIWGPLERATIELLIENGAIQGRLQVSEDGINFVLPGRMPQVRDSFPREMWGDVVPPGAVRAPPTAAPQAPVTAPAPQGPAPAAGGVPLAGPGIPKPGTPITRPPPPARPPGPPPGAPKPAAAGAPAPGAPPPGAPKPAAPAAPPPARPATPTSPITMSIPTVAPETVEPPPAQGSLAAHSPVRLYSLIAAGNQSGLLSLVLADGTVGIHFRKGNPELIESSHPDDALETWLQRSKLVSPEQYQQAEAAKGRFGGEVLAALFGLGLLQPASAFAQLAQRAQGILLKGLRADAGSFTFEPKELPAAKAMPLGNKWAVLSDLVRRIPSADLRRLLQPVIALPVMKSSGHVATGDLRLTPHEVRVLALIDGVRSTAQLLNDIPQDAEHLLRLVFLLKELGSVSFAASRAPVPEAPPPAAPAPAAQAPAAKPAAPAPAPAAQAPAAKPAAPAPAPAARPAAPAPVARPAAPAPAAQAPAAKPAAPAPAPVAKPAAPAPAPVAKPAAPAPAPVAKPAAPAPAPAPASAAPAAATGAGELPALRELAQKMKEQNHFERLGVGADTNGPAVKIAYFKLAKQYHPDTLPPGAPPELEKLKADIFAYIGEAQRVLADEKSRVAYIDELKHGGNKEAEVDVEGILKSEDLFRRAGVYLKNRKFADAAKLLDEAIQLNPEEAEFYAWRGYARFFTFEDKKQGFNEAFRDIQVCLKKNDRVAAGHYFLGVIAKLCGDTSGSLKHFQRTVELQPNHIDAQREIRMAAQKK
ncbi:J domain-containing protein [Melittangium boletus]|uniref:J domain-containing protein n=1 Tax=Melittangium boletus TaxID=83453 RepID=UPI003DA397CD